MSAPPIICFGQQPCGFFPRRFLFAKIQTARRLQSQLGGEIVFFYHDSDHDPRETRTILRHRRTNEPAVLNFAVKNKVQRKFSPLFLKQIAPDWRQKTALQLQNYVEKNAIELFMSAGGATVAEFCLDMYRRMGLLTGIRIVCSGDAALRRAACEITDYYADVPHEGEIVRARIANGVFQLHEGGNAFITLSATAISKEQISPARDTRLRWMQSIVHCTHYVCGAGEQDYLRVEETPEITFVKRDSIERSDEAYTEICN
jgi:hypothetical protein